LYGLCLGPRAIRLEFYRYIMAINIFLDQIKLSFLFKVREKPWDPVVFA